MPITPDLPVRADDFIYTSERDATPANDEGRVPKLEADGKLSNDFLNLTAYQLINIFKNGATTYDVSTASGSQTIAHGLGKIPKKVRLTANLVGNAECITQAITVYNGTTQSSQYWSMQSGSGSSEEVGSTFKLYYTVGSGDYVTGVITFDATNITITWTKTGTPTGTAQIMWEAEA